MQFAPVALILSLLMIAGKLFSDVVKIACVYMRTVIKGHIGAFNLNSLCFFSTDHGAKEPVEDTDPSTLSFNVVGCKFYVNGDKSWFYSFLLCYFFYIFVTLYLLENQKYQNKIFPRYTSLS